MTQNVVMFEIVIRKIFYILRTSIKLKITYRKSAKIKEKKWKKKNQSIIEEMSEKLPAGGIERKSAIEAAA